MDQRKDGTNLAANRKTDTSSSDSPITFDDTWRDFFVKVLNTTLLVDTPKPFYLSFVGLYVAITAFFSNLMVRHNILGKLIFLAQSFATYTNGKLGVNITIDAETVSTKILEQSVRVDELFKAFLTKFDVWFDLFRKFVRDVAVKALDYAISHIEPYFNFAVGWYTFVTSFVVSKFEQSAEILRRLISTFRRIFPGVYDLIESLVSRVIVASFAFFHFLYARVTSARNVRETIQSNFDVTKHKIDDIIFERVVRTLRFAKCCALALSTRAQPLLERFRPQLEQLRTKLMPYLEKLQQVILAQRENRLYGATLAKVLDFSNGVLSEAGILWTAASADEGEGGGNGLEGEGTAEVALDVGASD